MRLFRKKKDDLWLFIGFYCEKHMVSAVRAVGRAIVMVVDRENLELSERCSIISCGDIPFVAVYRNKNDEVIDEGKKEDDEE